MNDDTTTPVADTPTPAVVEPIAEPLIQTIEAPAATVSAVPPPAEPIVDLVEPVIETPAEPVAPAATPPEPEAPIPVPVEEPSVTKPAEPVEPMPEPEPPVPAPTPAPAPISEPMPVSPAVGSIPAAVLALTDAELRIAATLYIQRNQAAISRKGVAARQEKQRRNLDAIVSYVAANGPSSLPRIARKLSLSPGSASHYLQTLVKQKRLKAEGWAKDRRYSV